ncbi:DUF4192 family protein [Arthrobacter sp. 1P04PC]|uniref:DUF4192 family protein n=1 Tax=unclassified Arthrobacter TaxID=235627 RepID=UPI0039A21E5C
MTAPDHLTISGPADVLGFIPHSLGYWPASSVVAMTMQGKRLGATLRVDLPGPGRFDRTHLRAFARSVAGYLVADRDADGSLVALFTAPPPGDDGSEPDTVTHPAPSQQSLDRLLRELETALASEGLPVRDAWIVGERYWRNAHCSDPGCCAPPGRPIAEIRDSVLSAEMVFRGSRVGAAPGTAASAGASGLSGPAGKGSSADPSRPGRDPARVLAAERRFLDGFGTRWRDRRQFEAVLDVWEHVLDGQAATPDRGPVPSTAADQAADRVALTPGTLTSDPALDTPGHSASAGQAAGFADDLAGYLRATLCVAAWRDAVLVLAAAGRRAAVAGAEDFGLLDDGPGGDPLLPEGLSQSGNALAGGPGPVARPLPPPPGYGEVLLGLEPVTPDWRRLARLDAVLDVLYACGAGESRAAALTGRGWIEWCRGRGSYAAALYSAATAEYPGYRLAELLGELARRGTLCGWAARKESAWQKFDPDAA